MEVIEEGDSEIVKLLMEFGADPFIKGCLVRSNHFDH